MEQNNTRIKLWADYRRKIYHSNQIQEVIKTANKQFKILNQRLIKIIPNYYQLFPKQKPINKNINNQLEPTYFNNEKLLQQIELISKLEEKNNLYYFDKISFKTGELDEVIAELQIKKQTKSINKNTISNNNKLIIRKPKKISFKNPYNN